LAHPRCARALKLQFNLVDLSRRSRSYEHRLYKYSKRGFAVAIPGLDMSKIDQNKVNSSRRDLEGELRGDPGLLKLLYLESINKKAREGKGEAILLNPPSRAFHREKELTHRAENASDYNSICIPYGPDWTAQACERYASRINWVANSRHVRFHMCNLPRPEVSICEVGSMSEVLEAFITVNVQRDSGKEPSSKVVTKNNMWMVENLGAQLTGSFNPINTPPEQWFQTAYISAAPPKKNSSTPPKKS